MHCVKWAFVILSDTVYSCHSMENKHLVGWHDDIFRNEIFLNNGKENSKGFVFFSGERKLKLTTC